MYCKSIEVITVSRNNYYVINIVVNINTRPVVARCFACTRTRIFVGIKIDEWGSRILNKASARGPPSDVCLMQKNLFYEGIEREFFLNCRFKIISQVTKLINCVSLMTYHVREMRLESAIRASVSLHRSKRRILVQLLHNIKQIDLPFF